MLSCELRKYRKQGISKRITLLFYLFTLLFYLFYLPATKFHVKKFNDGTREARRREKLKIHRGNAVKMLRRCCDDTRKSA